VLVMHLVGSQFISQLHSCTTYVEKLIVVFLTPLQETLLIFSYDEHSLLSSYFIWYCLMSVSETVLLNN
jgi:hypothetical protein